jgi:hypothetical protein
MSTDALLLSKFVILGVNDAVAVFKDVNIPTTCDDPDTVPDGKESVKSIVPLANVSVVTIVCADIVFVT